MLERIDEFLTYVAKEIPPYVVLIPCFLLILGCAIHLNQDSPEEKMEPVTEAIVSEPETMTAENTMHTIGVSYHTIEPSVTPAETVAGQIPTGINVYQTRDSLWEIAIDDTTEGYKVLCYERGSSLVDSRFQEDTVWIKEDADTLVNEEGTVALAFEDFGDQLYFLDLEQGDSTHYYRLSEEN